MFPLVARSTVDALRERIAFLEGELARVNSQNEELVNALTATNRGVPPFRAAAPKQVVPIQPRYGSFQAQKKLEAAHRGNVKYPFPNTPEFDKARKLESGGAS